MEFLFEVETFFCDVSFFNLETSNKHIFKHVVQESNVILKTNHKPKKGYKDDTSLSFFLVFLSTTLLFVILRFALQTVRLVSLALSCQGKNCGREL